MFAGKFPWELPAPVVPELINGAIHATTPAPVYHLPLEYHWDFVDCTRAPGELGCMTVYAALAYGRFDQFVNTGRYRSLPRPVHVDVVQELPPLAIGNAQAVGESDSDLDDFKIVDLGMSDPLVASLRRDALILGGVRAGLASAYSLARTDLDDRETSEGVAATVVSVGDRFQVNLTPDRNAAVREFLNNELTAEEKDLFFTMAKIGMGVAPLVGACILGTGYRFVSTDTDNVNRAFGAMERHVISSASASVQSTWNVSVERYRDLAFYKAAHPVRDRFLMALARDDALVHILLRANLGPVAIRLPYREPAIRAARAYMAIVRAVQEFCALSGFVISHHVYLDTALTYVSSIPDWGPVPAPPVELRAPLPANRGDAIHVILEPLLMAAAPAVATGCGMYYALVEQAGHVTDPNHDPKLMPPSIRNLRTDHFAEFTQGIAAVRSYYKRSGAVEKGDLKE